MCIRDRDDLALKYLSMLAVTLSSIKQYYDEKYDRDVYKRQVLRRAKKDVKVVGVGKKTIVSSHNLRITCDAETPEVSPNEDIEAVILPGGMPGTLNLEKSEKVNEFIAVSYTHLLNG